MWFLWFRFFHVNLLKRVSASREFYLIIEFYKFIYFLITAINFSLSSFISYSSIPTDFPFSICASLARDVKAITPRCE